MSHLELYHLSKITTAAKGLVVREVAMNIIKLLARDDDGTRPKLAALQAKVSANAASANERKRLEYAKAVRDMLDTRRFCTDPVSVDFEKMTKFGEYKTDQRIIICLTQVRVNNNLRYVACGIGGWSVFDAEDEVDLPALRVSDTFDQYAAAGRVAEIDLVCTSGPHAPAGTGQAILARLLGMIAKSRKAGGRRFKAVIANKAVGDGNDMPFTRLGAKFGMNAVVAKRDGMGNAAARDSEGALKKFCAAVDTAARRWEATGVSYLGDATAQRLCPTAPRSGRAYCT